MSKKGQTPKMRGIDLRGYTVVQNWTIDFLSILFPRTRYLNVVYHILVMASWEDNGFIRRGQILLQSTTFKNLYGIKRDAYNALIKRMVTKGLLKTERLSHHLIGTSIYFDFFRSDKGRGEFKMPQALTDMAAGKNVPVKDEYQFDGNLSDDPDIFSGVREPVQVAVSGGMASSSEPHITLQGTPHHFADNPTSQMEPNTNGGNELQSGVADNPTSLSDEPHIISQGTPHVITQVHTPILMEDIEYPQSPDDDRKGTATKSNLVTEITKGCVRKPNVPASRKHARPVREDDAYPSSSGPDLKGYRNWRNIVNGFRETVRKRFPQVVFTGGPQGYVSESEPARQMMDFLSDTLNVPLQDELPLRAVALEWFSFYTNNVLDEKKLKGKWVTINGLRMSWENFRVRMDSVPAVLARHTKATAPKKVHDITQSMKDIFGRDRAVDGKTRSALCRYGIVLTASYMHAAKVHPDPEALIAKIVRDNMASDSGRSLVSSMRRATMEFSTKAQEKGSLPLSDWKDKLKPVWDELGPVNAPTPKDEDRQAAESFLDNLVKLL